MGMLLRNEKLLKNHLRFLIKYTIFNITLQGSLYIMYGIMPVILVYIYQVFYKVSARQYLRPLPFSPLKALLYRIKAKRLKG